MSQQMPNAQQRSLSAVIFDMDGVICDTMSCHLKAWELYIRQTPELASAKIESLPQMGGKRNGDLLREILPQPPAESDIKRWGSAKEAVFRDLYREEIIWLPGLISFLNSLKVANLKIGLGTSACLENVELILNHENLGAFFDARVIETDVQRGKPDPQCYQLVAQRLGVSPESCLVFEDAIAGVQSAVGADMTCWGVLTTHTASELQAVGADICIQDFNDPRLDELLANSLIVDNPSKTITL
jgi:beta-phosphoglucomutase